MDIGAVRGKVAGSTLMIVGCCVGAGMLGLPLVTLSYGFIPSLIAIVLCWVFMLSAGLLLLEVYLWFDGKSNLVTVSESLLGRPGKYICVTLFLFLFFSLLVAYLSGSGEIVNQLLQSMLGRDVPVFIGPFVCSSVLFLCLLRGAGAIDRLNKLFMLGLVVSYFALVFCSVKLVKPMNYARCNHSVSMFFTFPVIIVSFGFQNMIPTLRKYIGNDVRKVRFSIVLGTAITLLIYIIWQSVIFGVISPSLINDSGKLSISISDLLSRGISNQFVRLTVQVFAFSALATSLITVALSFSDFLRDFFSESKRRSRAIALMIALCPLIFAVYFPNFFMKSLDLAGGLGAVMLFGALPVLMAWVGRYKRKIGGMRTLPGGRVFLSILLLISLGIFSLEVMRQFSVFSL